jgi:hypothetical protein
MIIAICRLTEGQQTEHKRQPAKSEATEMCLNSRDPIGCQLELHMEVKTILTKQW